MEFYRNAIHPLRLLEDRYVEIAFLGANRQVTGSRHLLKTGTRNIMVDCGMFQERDFIGRNWEPCPVPAREVDDVLITHAHLDHCGLLPKLVKEGFDGGIHSTEASAELIEIILRDSAKIQSEDLAYKMKRHRKEGRKGKYPPSLLYDIQDVENTLPLIRGVPCGGSVALGEDTVATFHEGGHILGAAMISVDVQREGRRARVIFSGDIGQKDRPIVRDPTLCTRADYVVIESTYGDRVHDNHEKVEDQLADIVNEAVDRGGSVVMPVFAVERSQDLIYHFGRLMHRKRIPRIPVYLDSPMAAKATEVFRRHHECYDDETQAMLAAGQDPFRFPELVLSRTTDESKAINRAKPPVVIMSTSGMCTAGRIKHHLAHHITKKESTIVFCGYQAHGTLGRLILEGNEEIRIHGRYLPVKARIRQINGVSGHADRKGLLAWLAGFSTKPKKVFVVHGEAGSANHFAELVRRELKLDAVVPEYGETIRLE